ncbi:MAG: aspartate aminotransferase family protein [Chloroflexi bacterium]|nr:aspartate aminotransferase family protein [Chloroflexota bacterium]
MSTTGMGTRLDEAAIARLVEDDLGHLLHPQYYAPDHADPVIFASGEGVWLTDVRGRRYIDALSSLWNVAVGHGRTELAEAAAEQMRRVAFTNGYTGFSNVPAIELARTVAGLAYEGMEGVYFTNSGSESNEAAFKTARFYWNLMGRPGKVQVVARERAYHGGTLATSAMTGIPAFWKYFGPLPDDVIRATRPENQECDCRPNADGECAHWVEAAIERAGPDTVACVIAEPVKGAGGVWTPSDDYFPRLREICDRHEVLLISDEVITGFGRTGHWFALERWGVVPDILSVAKAITSGYVPMGAIVLSAPITEALHDLPPDARFMHAYTNSAHPTAAAVALRNLRLIREERLVENGRAMGERLGEGLRSALGEHPHVANIRQLGLIAGLSLVRDRAGGERFEASAGVGGRVARHMREEGSVITRFVGDEIVLAPPLVVDSGEVDHVVGAVEAAVRATLG